MYIYYKQTYIYIYTYIYQLLNVTKKIYLYGVYQIGKFVICVGEIDEIYKIYIRHQNCAGEKSPAHYKLSNLGCLNTIIYTGILTKVDFAC